MKRVIYFLIVGLMTVNASVFAQKSDDRMKRDIAVMETALSEMIKQELDQRNFFFSQIKGNYVAGYGVTFTVPTSMISSGWSTGGNAVIVDGQNGGFAYNMYAPSALEMEISEKEAKEAEQLIKSTKTTKNQKDRDKAEQDAQIQRDKAVRAEQEAREAEGRSRVSVYGVQTDANGYGVITRSNRKRINTDSLNTVNNAKIVNAAKTFIADYGDMLSQLTPNERIVVTTEVRRKTTSGCMVVRK